MTPEDVVRNKKKWVGGRIRTEESGGVNVDSIVIDIKNRQGIFCVDTACGTPIWANIDFVHIRDKDDRLEFNIPYIGTAYIYENLHQPELGGEA